MSNNFSNEHLIDRRSKSRGSDRRVETRHKCTLPVSVHIKSEIEYGEVAALLNISYSGARIKLRNPVPKATFAILKFYILRNDHSGYLDQEPINARSSNCSEIYDTYFHDVGFFYLEKPDIIHGILIILKSFDCPIIEK